MSLVVLRRSGSGTSLAEGGKLVGALKDAVNNSGWFNAKTRHGDYDNYQPLSVGNTKDLEDTLA